MTTIKRLLARVVGEERLGYLDYFRSSAADREWSGPFNGQAFRRKMLAAICRQIKFSYVVETGTFRGVTTQYLAEHSGVPVYSIEVNGRNFGFAKARLRKLKTVKLFRGDSVNVLGRLFDNGLGQDGIGVYYLDAHWERHLPLKEEVAVIFRRACSAVVMIDDFQVEDDPGYLFDDYGESGALTLSYLKDTINNLGLAGFYPRRRACEETGKRRGMIVLTDQTLATELRHLEELREIELTAGCDPASSSR